jgi:hypothetical protein
MSTTIVTDGYTVDATIVEGRGYVVFGGQSSAGRRERGKMCASF